MNFWGNEFEQFLRRKADEFTLYPSNRVWYSIYNNIHPGNRLPSVSMSIVLLAILFLTGYLNTGPAIDARPQKLSRSQPIIANPGFAALLPSREAMGISAPAVLPNQPESPGKKQGSIIKTGTGSSAKPSVLYNATSFSEIKNTTKIDNSKLANRSISLAVNNETLPTSKQRELSENRISHFDQENTTTKNRVEPGTVAFNENTIQTPIQVKEPGNPIISSTYVLSSAAPTPVHPLNNKHTPAGKKAETDNNTLINESSRSWMEHDIMYNRKAPRKWAGKMSWQAYITPGIVYRTLANNAAGKSLSGNGRPFFNNNDLNSSIIRHKPSVGLEAGLSLQYDLLKRIKLKGGIQVNFTRYNARAYENHHPISTAITLNGNDGLTVYEVFRSTNYSNMTGLNEVKLHNQTLQFSMPLGVDYRLTQSGNISWYAGATLQPTIIVLAQSYLISSDRRNYVKDASMLNRFNLNAGFETYLSVKVSDYSWQIGPQFRTQLFSTNNKIYSVEERLLSIGIKAGITKKL